jgi:hypothetical protein
MKTFTNGQQLASTPYYRAHLNAFFVILINKLEYLGPYLAGQRLQRIWVRKKRQEQYSATSSFEGAGM